MDPDDERVYKIPRVFNPNSAKILDCLKEGPKYKQELQEETGLMGDEIVLRISDLEEYGIVSSKMSRKGEKTVGLEYSFNEENYQEVLEETIELLGEDLQGDELTGRLKKLAENAARNDKDWSVDSR